MRRFALVLALLAVLFVTPQASAWSWPLRGDVLRPYSLGPDPYAAGQHRGVDVAGSAGETVRAPAAGTISFVGVVPSSGRTVTIQTDGYAVSLTHLGETTIAKGATVAEGDAVGVAGQSGDAEWPTPYVHLGIRVSSAADGYVDPATLLPPRAVVPPPPAAAAPVVAATPAPVVAPVTSTTPPSVTAPVAGASPSPSVGEAAPVAPAAAPSAARDTSATANAAASTIAAAPLEPAGSKAGAAGPGGGHQRAPVSGRDAVSTSAADATGSQARADVASVVASPTAGSRARRRDRRLGGCRGVGRDRLRPRVRTSATSVLQPACPGCVGAARGGWRPRSAGVDGSTQRNGAPSCERAVRSARSRGRCLGGRARGELARARRRPPGARVDRCGLRPPGRGGQRRNVAAGAPP